MKRLLTLAVCLALPLFATSPLEGKVNKKKIDSVIKKGANYLAGKQETDGSWKGTGSHSKAYPVGSTAIVTLTLLKCGVPARLPMIQKAFRYMNSRPFQRTYSVAIYLMALEAKYTPPEKVMKKYQKKYSRGTIIRKVFKRHAKKADRKHMQKAVQWLIKNQKDNGGWGYPHSRADNSNTQYALLGLAAAERMGARVPMKVYMKVAEYFLKGQQKKGKKVKPFPVPAAEEPINRVLRKRWEKKMKKEGKTGTVQRRRDAYGKTRENLIYQARGWGYVNQEVQMEQNPKATSLPSTGSMTTAGIACLVISKAQLEKSRHRKAKAMVRKINRGIRDGCAWVADRFSVTTNPGSGGWHFYYLYGLERAGMLTGVYEFGKHDWYEEGAKYILKHVNADGSICPSSSKDPLIDTCFSLLFLKRATVPVRKRKPKRVITGSGRK